MPVNVNISIDTSAVAARIRGASGYAVKEVSGQVLSDCNRFCPEDQGVLINSSHINTDIECETPLRDPTDEQQKMLDKASGSDLANGKIIWDVPYAKFLYYGLVMIYPVTGSTWAPKSEDKVVTGRPITYHGAHRSSTPCKLWCEKARETYNNEWLELFQRALERGLQ